MNTTKHHVDLLRDLTIDTIHMHTHTGRAAVGYLEDLVAMGAATAHRAAIGEPGEHARYAITDAGCVALAIVDMATAIQRCAPTRAAPVLTTKQRVCLDEACRGAIDPFDYGSTTIAALKKAALIEPAPPTRVWRGTRYVATEAGHAARAAFPRGWDQPTALMAKFGGGR
jgi:hypothetical protein